MSLFSISPDWDFAAHVSSGRKSQLVANADFDELARKIVEEATRISYDVELGNNTYLRACKRPVFSLCISPDTFDAFFNGPGGYRAQYLVDPELGQFANSFVIASLKDKLLSMVDGFNAAHELSLGELESSLTACSAKVWIDEDEFPFQALTEDLNVSLWRAAAAIGCRKATWGLCAPQASRLKLIGAFIDSFGNEVVPADKIRRRFEIHVFGFS